MKLPEEGIHVIQNCIPKNLQDAIEEFYFSEKCIWGPLNFNTRVRHIKVEDSVFLNLEEFLFISPIIKNCLKQIDVEYEQNKIILTRALHQEKKDSNVRNNMHIDTDKRHYSVIYYTNDTDGPTLFFNKTLKDLSYEKYDEMRKKQIWRESQKNFLLDKDIVFSLKPQKGTAVVFDGQIYHGSTTPTLKDRCIINFCYEWS